MEEKMWNITCPENMTYLSGIIIIVTRGRVKHEQRREINGW